MGSNTLLSFLILTCSVSAPTIAYTSCSDHEFHLKQKVKMQLLYLILSSNYSMHKEPEGKKGRKKTKRGLYLVLPTEEMILQVSPQHSPVRGRCNI